MIKDFLLERRSWILLFCCYQLLLVLIGFLDPSIPFTSILYYVFLSALIFIIFITIRCIREASFYKQLKEWHPSSDLTGIKGAGSPFKKIVGETLRSQKDYYNGEKNGYLTNLEQEKDELVMWIHDVKTPLTTMKLMLDRVEDEELKSQLMYEWLRIHLLLDRQLHEKRIPFMENDLYIEKIDLESLIYGEIRGLKSWCLQKGIGFVISLDVTEVLTDVKWISFIIRQLLTNAVKYSDSSDVTINSFMQNDNIHLLIQDAGRGINPKDLPRIFDRGFTSTTNHNDNAATGMGLYLTKKAAEILKIHIDVESKVDEGTIFTLTFAKKNDFVSITGM